MQEKTVPQCLIGGDGRTDADGHGGRRATKTGATAKCRVRSIGIYWTGTTHATTCSYSAEKKKLYNMVGALKHHVSLCETQEDRELPNAQFHIKLFSELATCNRTSNV